MPIAKTPNEIWTYELRVDREGPEKIPREKRARFILKAPTAEQQSAYINALREPGYGTACLYLVMSCLVRWENFFDASGKPVPFLREIKDGSELPMSATMDWIVDYIGELAGAILARTRITEEESKNSESADTLSPAK